MLSAVRPKVLIATAVLFAAPAFAADMPAPPSSPPPSSAPMQTAAPKHVDPLEARIVELRDKLQVTDTQEKEWKSLVKVMHENASNSRELVLAKRQNEETMTAVDDLRAYAEVAEEHAKGVKHLAKAFEALYAVMSDDQKKVADDFFRQHKRDVNAHHDAQ
jgi:hypothetical protein